MDLGLGYVRESYVRCGLVGEVERANCHIAATAHAALVVGVAVVDDGDVLGTEGLGTGHMMVVMLPSPCHQCWNRQILVPFLLLLWFLMIAFMVIFITIIVSVMVSLKINKVAALGTN